MYLQITFVYVDLESLNNQQVYFQLAMRNIDDEDKMMCLVSSKIKVHMLCFQNFALNSGLLLGKMLTITLNKVLRAK